MTHNSQKPEPQPLLKVNREQFLDGLHLVKKIKGLGRKPVVFSFGQGQLSVEFPDMTFRADAEGQWNGKALVPITFLRDLAKTPPLGDGLLTVTVDDGKIRISVRSHSCDWEEVS